MATFLERYDADTHPPTRREAWHDLVRRTLVPALALWVLVVGIGLLIRGPLGDLEGEDVVNEGLVEARTPVLNSLTSVWSLIGSTEFIIGACLIAMLVLWRRVRQWWLAFVPAIAVSVQALIFMSAALVVGRSRPEVEQLEESPPTSSFPSGHTGAATAFYVVLAMLSQRIKNPVLRWTATVLCLLVPLAVGFARLYRGMHHPSDVAVGAINGLVCAGLAWRYLRRDQTELAEDVQDALTDPDPGEPDAEPTPDPSAQTRA
ncbi:MAG: phosphatase family protein [Actinotalea sp.]|nr:phosphatase family protein [Actinotalea sp.]